MKSGIKSFKKELMSAGSAIKIDIRHFGDICSLNPLIFLVEKIHHPHGPAWYTPG